jgi:2-hydroxychromene-2-carboxylate isomerase
MSERTPLRFFFDLISPYAYVAWTQIHALAAKHGRRVSMEPVLFAAVLNALGQKGPAEIPPKRLYAFKDAYRKAAHAGVGPLVPPPSHPFNPLLALRAIGAPMSDEMRRRFIDGLFNATWRGGGGVESEEQLARIAGAAGLDAASVVRHAKSAEAKAELRLHTEEALGLGVFGVPFMVADGEGFWGVDSLDSLDAFLAGRDPVPPDLSARWRDLPASAKR